MYTQVFTLLLYSYTARSIHATVNVTAVVEQGWTFFLLVCQFHIARVFAVIIVTYCHGLESVWRLGYWLEVGGIVVRFPAGQTYFTLLPKSVTALGPILPYVQWIRERFPREWSGRGVKLATHTCHVLRLMTKIIEIF
jgi:hypothetical protein